MSNKSNQDILNQMSISQIISLLSDRENTFSSEDLSKIIDKLSGVKRAKEAIEVKKRQQEELKKLEREAREEKERKRQTYRRIKIPVVDSTAGKENY